jgi:hypothetical protein
VPEGGDMHGKSLMLSLMLLACGIVGYRGLTEDDFRLSWSQCRTDL